MHDRIYKCKTCCDSCCPLADSLGNQEAKFRGKRSGNLPLAGLQVNNLWRSTPHPTNIAFVETVSLEDPFRSRDPFSVRCHVRGRLAGYLTQNHLDKSLGRQSRYFQGLGPQVKVEPNSWRPCCGSQAQRPHKRYLPQGPAYCVKEMPGCFTLCPTNPPSASST